MSPVPSYDLDVVATRGDAVESIHRVSAAIACGDSVVGFARDPETHTFWRSCAKPFQLIPFLETGELDSLGWGADQIALACASHGGEPEHVAIAERMLTDLGLEEGDLVCGVTDPLSQRGVRILRESGGRPTRLHNNCSGKHAAMLARARTAGWPTAGYHRRDHPVQQSILGEIEQWSGVSRNSMSLAIDGCGAVVFGMPLDGMARAYARLARAVRSGATVASRIVEAMTANPFLVGGTDRFDTILMEEAPGILSKIGAEGVHAIAVIEAGLGIAIKVEDGSARGQYPAVLGILQRLGALPTQLPPRLAEFARKPVRDTRHEIVGEVLLRAMM